MSRRTFLHHDECPKCQSADNLAVYWDYPNQTEIYFCNTPGCGYKLGGKQAQQQNKQPMTLPTVTKRATRRLRGIDPGILEKFGVYLSREVPGYESQNRIVFPYRDSKGKPQSYKHIRLNRDGSLDKSSIRTGPNWSNELLFGMGIHSNNKRLVVTEGELDCMSVTNLTGLSAVTAGSSNNLEPLKKQCEYIESFGKVLCLFDNDEAGWRAKDYLRDNTFRNSFNVFYNHVPTYLTHGVEFGCDGNDALRYARSKNFSEVRETFMKDVVYASENVTPSFVYSKEELIQECLKAYWDGGEDEGTDTGFRELTEILGGWRFGELTTILAPTSVGKSTFSRATLASLINRGYHCILVSLEETPRSSIDKIRRMMYGGSSSREEYQEQMDTILTYLYVYRGNGTQRPEELCQHLQFMAKAYESSFVLLDNLTRALPNREPRMEASNLLNGLTDVAKNQNCHVFNVSHVRRQENKKEGQPPSIQEARESGNIENMSDNVISLGRKRDEATTKVCVLKNRDRGDVGDFNITYDVDTNRYQELEYYDRVPETNRQEFREREPLQNEFQSGELPTEVGKDRMVRQQSRSTSSARDGVPGDSLPQNQNERETSAGDSSENFESLPGLLAGDEPGFDSDRSEGLPRQEREEEPPQGDDIRSQAARLRYRSALYWRQPCPERAAGDFCLSPFSAGGLQDEEGSAELWRSHGEQSEQATREDGSD
jgi:twinkle protein